MVLVTKPPSRRDSVDTSLDIQSIAVETRNESRIHCTFLRLLLAWTSFVLAVVLFSMLLWTNSGYLGSAVAALVCVIFFPPAIMYSQNKYTRRTLIFLAFSSVVLFAGSLIVLLQVLHNIGFTYAVVDKCLNGSVHSIESGSEWNISCINFSKKQLDEFASQQNKLMGLQIIVSMYGFFSIFASIDGIILSFRKGSDLYHPSVSPFSNSIV